MVAPTTEGIYIVKNDPENGKYYKKSLVKKLKSNYYSM
jgi:hypothetical protein